MIKKILVLLIFLMNSYAKEPNLMELMAIYKNAYFLFKNKNTTIMCSAYGVIPLDKLYSDPQLNTTCKSAIVEFIKANPILFHFGAYHLKLRQWYHVELQQNNKCIVYARGKRDYSTMLLYKGIGIIDPKLKDEIWVYKYKKVQKSAIEAKKGLWQNYRVKTCVSQLLKE